MKLIILNKENVPTVTLEGKIPAWAHEKFIKCPELSQEVIEYEGKKKHGFIATKDLVFSMGDGEIKVHIYANYSVVID